MDVGKIPAFAGMTDLGLIQFSMSVGHSFARGENGNAVSGVEKEVEPN
jgi:hypothetical protein